jgi:hypothetical protein
MLLLDEVLERESITGGRRRTFHRTSKNKFQNVMSGILLTVRSCIGPHCRYIIRNVVENNYVREKRRRRIAEKNNQEEASSLSIINYHHPSHSVIRVLEHNKTTLKPNTNEQQQCNILVQKTY